MDIMLLEDLLDGKASIIEKEKQEELYDHVNSARNLCLAPCDLSLPAPSLYVGPLLLILKQVGVGLPLAPTQVHICKEISGKSVKAHRERCLNGPRPKRQRVSPKPPPIGAC